MSVNKQLCFVTGGELSVDKFYNNMYIGTYAWRRQINLERNEGTKESDPVIRLLLIRTSSGVDFMKQFRP
jgi:hypothetical protein